jgi:glycosyltransferase 2 family protein
MAIPISLGGWGIRESSMVVGLASFGVPEASALALSISYGIGTVVAGVVGLCFWLAGSER